MWHARREGRSLDTIKSNGPDLSNMPKLNWKGLKLNWKMLNRKKTIPKAQLKICKNLYMKMRKLKFSGYCPAWLGQERYPKKPYFDCAFVKKRHFYRLFQKLGPHKNDSLFSRLPICIVSANVLSRAEWAVFRALQAWPLRRGPHPFLQLRPTQAPVQMQRPLSPTRRWQMLFTEHRRYNKNCQPYGN